MWYTVNDKLAVNSLFYNFLPSWWNKNYGIKFGEKFIFDPDYRIEIIQFMERTVNERFPDLHIGSKNPEPNVVLPDFGNAITPAAAGCEVVYPEDNYPWNKHLPEDAMSGLKLPHLAEVFPYNEIVSQVRYLNSKLGKDVSPCWNSRGVLNDAVLIRGPEFFTELSLESERATKLLDYSYSILTSVVKYNHNNFSNKNMVMLTNCTIMMINPDMYRDIFLTYDRKIYELAYGFNQEFGIHHCGVFDKYIPEYRKIPKVNFIEIGWGSDIKSVLSLFPEAVIQYIFSAVFVSSASRNQIRNKTKEILEDARGNWHRFKLSVPDIDFGTPDENLYEIYKCCKDAS